MLCTQHRAVQLRRRPTRPRSLQLRACSCMYPSESGQVPSQRDDFKSEQGFKMVEEVYKHGLQHFHSREYLPIQAVIVRVQVQRQAQGILLHVQVSSPCRRRLHRAPARTATGAYTYPGTALHWEASPCATGTIPRCQHEPCQCSAVPRTCAEQAWLTYYRVLVLGRKHEEHAGLFSVVCADDGRGLQDQRLYSQNQGTSAR